MPERMAHVYDEKSYFVPAVLVIATIVAMGFSAYYFYPRIFGGEYKSVLEQLDASSLPASFEQYAGAQRRLDQLKREPCDREAILPLSELMTKAGYPRESAKSLIKFGEKCGASVKLLDPAYDSLIRVGDFKGAVIVASEMIKINPAIPNYRFWRGQAYEGEKNYKAALSDYVSALQFSGNLSRVGLNTFFKVSQMYAEIGRPCDAITPLEIYVSFNAPRRQTDQISKLISDWATQGSCRANHAVGGDTVLLPPDNIIDVVINGARGRMVVDTGATLVSITPSFAMRAKIVPDEHNMMTVNVVGGTSQSAPGYASLIQVGKTRAANVPVGVSVGDDKAYGPDIDGLLGMTFLARFIITISGGTLELKPRTLN